MPKRRSSKKKRNISQKQLAALARGREIRANNIRIRNQNAGGNHGSSSTAATAKRVPFPRARARTTSSTAATAKQVPFPRARGRTTSSTATAAPGGGFRPASVLGPRRVPTAAEKEDRARRLKERRERDERLEAERAALWTAQARLRPRGYNGGRDLDAEWQRMKFSAWEYTARIAKGTAIEARFIGNENWYQGTVAHAHDDGTYDIDSVEQSFDIFHRIMRAPFLAAPDDSSIKRARAVDVRRLGLWQNAKGEWIIFTYGTPREEAELAPKDEILAIDMLLAYIYLVDNASSSSRDTRAMKATIERRKKELIEREIAIEEEASRARRRGWRVTGNAVRSKNEFSAAGTAYRERENAAQEQREREEEAASARRRGWRVTGNAVRAKNAFSAEGAAHRERENAAREKRVRAAARGWRVTGNAVRATNAFSAEGAAHRERENAAREKREREAAEEEAALARRRALRAAGTAVRGLNAFSAAGTEHKNEAQEQRVRTAAALAAAVTEDEEAARQERATAWKHRLHPLHPPTAAQQSTADVEYQKWADENLEARVNERRLRQERRRRKAGATAAVEDEEAARRAARRELEDAEEAAEEAAELERWNLATEADLKRPLEAPRAGLRHRTPASSWLRAAVRLSADGRRARARRSTGSGTGVLYDEDGDVVMMDVADDDSIRYDEDGDVVMMGVEDDDSDSDSDSDEEAQ